jgi:hypothetical protein
MEQLERELREWELLQLWGGTPAHVEAFIKGQQDRIHATQDVERELAAANHDCEVMQNAINGECGWQDMVASLRRDLAAANNEIESRRADSAQLERIASAVQRLAPEFQSACGSEADHAEAFVRCMVKQVEAANERIRRLETAGDAMADVLVWSAGVSYKKSHTALAWRKAKEAKP